MKRKLIIIAIILLVILGFVMGGWMIARKSATNQGRTPPTFREFLGIGVSTKPATPGTNQPGASEFTDPLTGLPITPGTTPNTKTPVTIPLGTSVFTNGGFTPIGGSPTDPLIGGGGIGGGNGGGGNGGDSSGTGGTGGGTGGGGTGGIKTPPVLTTVAECSEADLSINFTPDEINRLNVLKNRFYAIAADLNTDNDVATELANYDTFKAKSKKITELYNYCKNSSVYTSAQASTHALAPYGTAVPGLNGPMNYRVATPFWHDLTKDNDAFIHQGVNWNGVFHDSDLIFPERSIEHALRLNLW